MDRGSVLGSRFEGEGGGGCGSRFGVAGAGVGAVSEVGAGVAGGVVSGVELMVLA